MIMKKTKMVLIAILVFTLIGLGISIVQSFTKGIPVEWMPAGMIFAVLACAFEDLEKKEEKARTK